MAVLSIWWVVGLFLDGRLHFSGGQWKFFTPEHAVLYTAFPLLGTAFLLLVVSDWPESDAASGTLLDRYRLSLVGTGLFGVGGLVDYYWHQAPLFGVDGWILFSPPHLLVVASGGLIVSGPLRALWPRTESDIVPWWTQLPMLLSATALLSVASFLTILVNPFTNPLAAAPDSAVVHDTVPQVLPSFHLTQEIGMASILLQTVILMAIVLVLVRRFSLLPGSFSLLFGINAALTSLLVNQIQFLPAVVAAGAIADGLYVWTRSHQDRRWAFHLFSFAVPVVLFGLYFLQISLLGTITWTPTIWVGTIVLSGVTGFTMSYLLQPPMAGGRVNFRPSTESKEPALSAETKANIETFSSTDTIDVYSERATDGLFPQERKAIERHFTEPEARVLDLGCGTGRATHPFSEMGYDVIGVDPSETMVEKANSTYPQLDFIAGDATNLHFQDEVFDYVVFTYYGLDYIHPETSRIRALQEIHRVLKPGGVFIFSSHNWWHMPPSVLYEGWDVLYPLLRRENVLDPQDRYSTVEEKIGETMIYLSSPAKQWQQLKKCKFKLIDVIGKRDTSVRYVEVAPHYVARKPVED